MSGAVHDHAPMCNERRLPNGLLRGACLDDDGQPTAALADPETETDRSGDA